MFDFVKIYFIKYIKTLGWLELNNRDLPETCLLKEVGVN